MMEKHGTEIIYVRGNHDDFLDNLAPLQFANLTITKITYWKATESIIS